MTINSFVRSDLAAENVSEPDCPPSLHSPDLPFNSSFSGSVKIEKLSLPSGPEASALRQPPGHYVTLSFGKPWLFGDDQRKDLVLALSRELRALLPAPDPSLNASPVLAVGLGNRAMTADAIGPQTIDRLTVTNHVRTLDPHLFLSLHRRPLAAFTPGVLGDTGVETLSSVRALCTLLHPCAVILVDALAARSTERLASTIQLSDCGIRPGSGVGNDRPGITPETLGCPAVAVGVPLVVDSSTLVWDALEHAGVSDLPESLSRVLENGRGFFVSLKETDAALDALSSVIAESVDLALAL